jgi:hypothetical protein
MAKVILLKDLPSGTTSKNAMFVPGGALTTVVDTNSTQTMTGKTLSNATISGAGTAFTNTPVNVATLAALGGNIATAAPIVTAFPAFIHVTGANGNVGVQLPATVAGMQYEIENDTGANAVLKVYPAVNSTINALSSNTSISMAANSSAIFTAINATAWMTSPKVPS